MSEAISHGSGGGDDHQSHLPLRRGRAARRPARGRARQADALRLQLLPHHKLSKLLYLLAILIFYLLHKMHTFPHLQDKHYIHFYFPRQTQTLNDIFIQKRGKNYLLNNLLIGITKILLQKMGYYLSEVQVLGSGQQINILVAI